MAKKQSKIKPLGSRVLIEPMSREEKTEAGIFLPSTADKERPEQGKVVAVGPGKKDKSGTVIKPEVSKGDIVIFSKYGPKEVKLDEKEYLIADMDDILAVIE